MKLKHRPEIAAKWVGGISKWGYKRCGVDVYFLGICKQVKENLF